MIWISRTDVGGQSVRLLSRYTPLGKASKRFLVSRTEKGELASTLPTRFFAGCDFTSVSFSYDRTASLRTPLEFSSFADCILEWPRCCFQVYTDWFIGQTADSPSANSLLRIRETTRANPALFGGLCTTRSRRCELSIRKPCS